MDGDIIKDKVMFEGLVAYKNNKFDTLLTINEKHLLFEKKKGLLKKKYVVVKDVLLDDIKVIKDNVKIEQKKYDVTISLKNENVLFTCESVREAKKVVSEIKKILVGDAKKGKFMKIAKGTAGVIGAAVASGVVGDVVEAIKEKDIKLAAKAVEKLADKI